MGKMQTRVHVERFDAGGDTMTLTPARRNVVA
jgi:hypothetical protein